MSEADIFEKILNRVRKDDSTEARVIILVVLFTIVFIIWAFWASESTMISKWAGVTSINLDKKGALSSAGSWGDSFGGFNALFGALGFAAVSATLYLQHKSLEQQRIDLHIQRFETTFFELLRLIRQLRSELQFQQSKDVQKIKSKVMVREEVQGGFDAIKFAFFEIYIKIRKKVPKGANVPKEIMSEIYVNCIHNRFESRFAPYFRIIYTVLHKIKNDEVLNDEQKYYYSRILRSQLTSHEIVLMSVNSLCPMAKDLFDHLVHFRMLKYAPDWGRKILSPTFPDEAFSARD
ncbi:MAG: putative phage abortive infection protein [Halothiobacillus sp.]|nr:putative phage abortive infection protein [Halothiobacillus sp.]